MLRSRAALTPADAFTIGSSANASSKYDSARSKSPRLTKSSPKRRSASGTWPEAAACSKKVWAFSWLGRNPGPPSNKSFPASKAASASPRVAASSKQCKASRRSTLVPSPKWWARPRFSQAFPDDSPLLRPAATFSTLVFCVGSCAVPGPTASGYMSVSAMMPRGDHRLVSSSRALRGDPLPLPPFEGEPAGLDTVDGIVKDGKCASIFFYRY